MNVAAVTGLVSDVEVARRVLGAEAAGLRSLAASLDDTFGRAVDALEVAGFGPLRATLVDAANPAVFVAAGDLGLSGAEAPEEMEGKAGLLALLDRVRRAAGVAMGLGATPEAVGLASPRVAAVAGPLAARTLEVVR